MEENQKRLDSVQDVLNIINRREMAYTSHIWIPSLGRDVPFKELNTSQQKRLIKSIIDSPVYNTEFIYTFKEIVKECCADSSININDLTILDKAIIAIGLRAGSIGDTVDIVVESKKTEEKIPTKLDLKTIYTMAKETMSVPQNTIFEDELYKIECGIPTMEMEAVIEKGLKENIDATKTTDDVKNAIGDIFVTELVKYIVAVSVKNDSGEDTPINWVKLSIKDRIQIIESFKTKILKSIIQFANQVRTEIDKVEIVNFSVKDEQFSRRLTIDGNFFMIS